MKNYPDYKGFVNQLDAVLSKSYPKSLEGGMMALIEFFRLPAGTLKELQLKGFLTKVPIKKKYRIEWQLGEVWTNREDMYAEVEHIIKGLGLAPSVQKTPITLSAQSRIKERISLSGSLNSMPNQRYLVLVDSHIEIVVGLNSARNRIREMMKKYGVTAGHLFRYERCITIEENA